MTSSSNDEPKERVIEGDVETQTQDVRPEIKDRAETSTKDYVAELQRRVFFEENE